MAKKSNSFKPTSSQSADKRAILCVYMYDASTRNLMTASGPSYLVEQALAPEVISVVCDGKNGEPFLISSDDDSLPYLIYELRSVINATSGNLSDGISLLLFKKAFGINPNPHQSSPDDIIQSVIRDGGHLFVAVAVSADSKEGNEGDDEFWHLGIGFKLEANAKPLSPKDVFPIFDDMLERHLAD